MTHCPGTEYNVVTAVAGNKCPAPDHNITCEVCVPKRIVPNGDLITALPILHRAGADGSVTSTIDICLQYIRANRAVLKPKVVRAEINQRFTSNRYILIARADLE